MSSAPSAERIAKDATWLAQALDPGEGLVRLVAMDREAYRLESFLDDRLLSAPIDAQIVSWPLIEEAAAQLRRSDARWIFHIGHVGSTLISRLLGEIDGVLSVREPRLLRDLATIPRDLRARYIAPAAKLMSRTFADEEKACVKATSFASEIAAELVPSGERALFVYAAPRNYIASILAGENSVRELRVLAPSRLARIQGRIGRFDSKAASDASLAAVAWACEMTSLEAAEATMGDRAIDWADFDSMLLDMAAGLGEICRFFGFQVDDDRISEIVGRDIMRRYSKSPDYEYSPALRRELIDSAQRRYASDIERAIVMLERLAEDSPLLMRALSRSKES